MTGLFFWGRPRRSRRPEDSDDHQCTDSSIIKCAVTDSIVGMEVQVEKVQSVHSQEHQVILGSSQPEKTEFHGGMVEYVVDVRDAACDSSKSDLESLSRGEPQSSKTIDLERYETELQERLDAIIALKGLVKQQSKTITSLRKRDRQKQIKLNNGSIDCSGEEIPSFNSSVLGDDEVECTENVRKRIVSFGPCLDRTDEEALSVLSFEEFESVTTRELAEMDGEYRDVIDEIKKRAEQINVAIALDELHTTKGELERVAKKLDDRCAEVHDLRTRLQAQEERVAAVELERDLCEAEIVWTKEELHACIEHMTNFGLITSNDRSIVQSSPSHAYDVVHYQRSLAAAPTKSGAAHNSVEKRGNQKNPCVVTPEHGGFPSVPENQTLGVRNSFSAWASRHGKLSDGKKLEFMDDGRILSPKHEQQEVQGPPSANYRSSGATKPKHFGLFRPQNRVDDDRPASKRSGVRKNLFMKKGPSRRNNSFETGSFHNSCDENIREDAAIALLQAEIKHLNSRLSSSTYNSYELRKRLNLVSRYYENMVRSLQQEVANLKTEKTIVEADMFDQVPALNCSQSTELSNFEAQLRMKPVIAQLDLETEKLPRENVFLADVSDVEDESSPPRFC